MRYISLMILMGMISTSLFAQDKHFSQFYASPIAVNPALTGAFDGKFRVGAIYRDQWRGAADNPFVTFAASMDMRFNLGKKRAFQDAAAGGILFFTDRVGGVDFNTNQMALSGAYHKALDRASTQYLSAGIKFGFTQRNVNYESLTFQDQFNGIDDYSSPTGEELPENNFAYGDLSAGLYYTITPKRQTSFYAGVALHHFNKSNASFYNEIDGTKHKIFMKTVGHIGARLPIGDNKQLFPRLMISMQGPHLQFDAGTSLRASLNDFSSMAIHFGAWVRPVKFDTGISLDAIIAMVGFEYENVLFGLSYDANINSLANYSKVHGAFELSVVYLGEYENETILCPTF
ncbi:MAG: type IX secretion system PorP/SprF family membrane protein [Maribacter sp.]|jgi:type IX secretion system PorP/SprF family membrane protein